jgi:hypothetical protein
VAVGYDADAKTVLIADRKLDEPQAVPMEELRRARNAHDYPMACGNEYDHYRGRVALSRPLPDAIRRAIRHNVALMRAEEDGAVPGAFAGIAGMRRLAADFASWSDIDDWSWAARFGYQVIVKRGSGGHFFRSLYTDFLRESADAVPALAESGLAERMQSAADRWIDFSSLLEEQSVRETCDRALFEQAGEALAQLADLEESIFDALHALCEREEIWSA